MSKFMTWSLKRPSTSTFNQYKQLAPGEPWYSKKYIEGTGGNGFLPHEAPEKAWSRGAAGFVRMIEKNADKIYALGMHEFMICDDGTIASMGHGEVMYPNGYYYYDQSQKILNAEETEIARAVPTSLRYLMHNYPQIRWSIQILATSNSSGDRVAPLLNNKSNQDNCIRQTRKIVELYKKAGFNIADVEVDAEKTTSPDGAAEKYRDFLVRVKNEVCIPTGTDLRVNLFAMTGDFNPAYYGWHDYATLASGRDKNGRQAIDEFQLMTYDFSWGGSAPGPSTPLWWLQNVLEHVKKVLPPEKTWIGNAGYGRRWPLSEDRYGVTFDYKQLMQAQNGEYVHNMGSTSEDGFFRFNDQDFIPIAGVNDPDSDYQITYLNVYDMFQAKFGKRDDNMFLPDDYVVSYSKKQTPVFGGLQAIAANPIAEGNASVSMSSELDGTKYTFYTASKARYVYDTTKKACIKETGKTGEDGKVTYNFELSSPGTYKVIAVVGFPFYGQDHFNISINGSSHTIGANIPDWYPFVTNPSAHYWDCGTYNLSNNNSISVGITNGAMIGGFIICRSFDHNLMGSKITYPANLQKMKKRGKRKNDGTSEIVEAKFPSKMIVTGELLRRPPRPAIIWEDMFGPHIQGDVTESTDLTAYPYYLRASTDTYVNGSGTQVHTVGTRNYCIDGFSNVGFSKGSWMVKDMVGSNPAYIHTDASSAYAQLVLNKTISGAVHIELDCRILDTDTTGKYGIRIIQQKGNPASGKIFRLNFQTKQIEYIDLDNRSNDRFVDMSESLAAGIGSRYTLKLQRLDGYLRFSVGDRLYMNFPANLQGAWAYGAYGLNCKPRIYRLNISTLERFEPLEKVVLHVDGQQYPFGEVERNVRYDEFGYLVYKGLPGNLTEAVRSIPSDADNIPANSVAGRAGTIFETEIIPENWSLDYKNMQLATINSWIGKKDVVLEMKDPGIWLKMFYIGDAAGYSVAYNSDKIGFMRTSQMVDEYGCKGIAMWTLGQEDPYLFSYIDTNN